MKNQKCISNIKTLHAFLNATKANWRNSIYIECSICKHEKTESCEDYLFAPNADGTPLLIPTSDMNIICNMITDKSECLGIMSNAKFKDLYEGWFEQITTDKNECPFINAVKQLGKPENW